MAQQSVILLDMDGVLLHPVGYKEALRASVNHFGRLMGLREPVGPTYEDIAVFEAHGFTCEWDSVAMSVASLMLAVLEEAPHLTRDTLDDTLAAIRESGVQVSPPDYGPLAREVAGRRDEGPRPSRFALEILLETAPQAAHGPLRELLADAYELAAPTTRIFQHHTLGSQRFAETYGEAASFETESLLATLDKPVLNAELRERLLASVANGTHRAVIYTARPSLLPADVDDPGDFRPLDVVPEAEIARKLVGLEALPMIGAGRMAWLAARNGARAENYVKPSPVQALASIGAALSRSEAPSLEAALALAEHGEVSGPLTMLEGKSTQVHVFEDSAGGIRAAGRGVELLREAGLDVTLEAVGVAKEPIKREALAPVAARVVEDVNAGLGLVL